MEGQACCPFFLNFSIEIEDTSICYLTDVDLELIPEDNPVGTTYEWNFGLNAVPATASGVGPHTVQYTLNGTKTVTVTATYLTLETVKTAEITVSACPGSLAGSVKDTFGNGIQGVTVRLFEDFDEDGVADNGTIIKSVNTTSAGSYTMTGLYPGSYVITCLNPGGSQWELVSGIDITEDGDVVPNTITTDLIIPVTIDISEVDSGNNYIFTPVDGIISGTVLDNLSAPIENAEINIYEDFDLNGVADGAAIATVFTDASGAYSATGIPSGKWGLGSVVRHYLIELVVPLGYTIVSGIDTTNDSDLVANVPTTDNIIPCSLINGETDANNNFIITL